MRLSNDEIRELVSSVSYRLRTLFRWHVDVRGFPGVTVEEVVYVFDLTVQDLPRIRIQESISESQISSFAQAFDATHALLRDALVDLLQLMAVDALAPRPEKGEGESHAEYIRRVYYRVSGHAAPGPFPGQSTLSPLPPVQLPPSNFCFADTITMLKHCIEVLLKQSGLTDAEVDVTTERIRIVYGRHRAVRDLTSLASLTFFLGLITPLVDPQEGSMFIEETDTRMVQL